MYSLWICILSIETNQDDDDNNYDDVFVAHQLCRIHFLIRSITHSHSHHVPVPEFLRISLFLFCKFKYLSGAIGNLMNEFQNLISFCLNMKLCHFIDCQLWYPAATGYVIAN